MDDQHSLLAGGFEHLIHAGSHSDTRSRRTLAPVFVPHIANDDRRFDRIPGGRISDRVKPTAAGLGFNPFAHVQGKRRTPRGGREVVRRKRRAGQCHRAKPPALARTPIEKAGPKPTTCSVKAVLSLSLQGQVG